MEHLDTDVNDRPVNPPKIITTRVLINPFDDIIQRHKVPTEAEKIEKDKLIQPKTKKNTNVVKNVNLLSFDHDDEEEEGDKEEKPTAKFKSSHDVLQDPKLSKEPAVSLEHLEYISKITIEYF